jgi:transposase
VANRLGMSPETLRKWLRQAEVDAGDRDGVTTAAAREIRELKRRNAELEQTIEILKAATSFFVREATCGAGASPCGIGRAADESSDLCLLSRQVGQSLRALP